MWDQILSATYKQTLSTENPDSGGYNNSNNRSDVDGESINYNDNGIEGSDKRDSEALVHARDDSSYE